MFPALSLTTENLICLTDFLNYIRDIKYSLNKILKSFINHRKPDVFKGHNYDLN